MDAISDLNDEQRKVLISQKEELIERYIDELDKRSTFNADISSGKYRSFVRRNNTVKEIVEEVLQRAQKS